jgi:hypothetical protein
MVMGRIGGDRGRDRTALRRGWVRRGRRFWKDLLSGVEAAGQDNCRCRYGWHDMPMEFYRGRPPEPDELEAIRQQIEQFDTIEAIDPELCGIVERNWPHLVSKLPPEDIDE